MTQIGINTAIALLVEALLPRFSPFDTVLQLHIRIDSYKPGGNNKSLPTELFEIIIHRPGNYTLVGWKKSKVVLSGEYDGTYTTTAHHDSAWKDDGFRFLNFYDGRQVNFVHIGEVKIGKGVIETNSNERTFTFEGSK